MPQFNETVLWTCLPNGTMGTGAGQALKLSVLVSPRLTFPSADPNAVAPLSDFPSFANWPDTLAKLMKAGPFTVQVLSLAGAQTYQAELSAPSNDPGAVPDPALWDAIFGTNGASTPVQSHSVEDFTKRFVLSYPAVRVRDTVQSLYQAVAIGSPSDFPSTQDLLSSDGYGLGNIVVTSYQNNRNPSVLPLPTGPAFETFLNSLKPQPPPGVPAGLTAKIRIVSDPPPPGGGFGSSHPVIDVSWNAVSGATSYNLYRATAPDSAAHVPATTSGQETLYQGGLGGTTYTEPGPFADQTTYFYQVTAVSANGESARSGEVHVEPYPYQAGPRIATRLRPRATGAALNSFSDSPPPSSDYTQKQWDLLRLQVFHQARTNRVEDPTAATPPTDANGNPLYRKPQATQLGSLPDPSTFQNTVDFHQRVSMLAKYPALMRRLGLIFDLNVTTGALPAVAGVSLVTPLAAPVSNVTPVTVFTGDGRPLPAGGAGLSGGQLDLSPNSQHTLIELDIDGAASKVMTLTSSLLQSRIHPTTDTPPIAALASLRSAGLSLVETGRDKALVDKFGQAANLNNSGSNAFLYAEDLVRGFRVDVSDDVESTWRSLVQRVGKYVVANTPLSLPPDEGLMQLAATSPSNPPPDPMTGQKTTDLYLHESLLTWNGWSLAAPRPFKAVGDTGIEEPGTVPGLNLTASFMPQPGSLPRLRFGRKYRMQARVADLAGNGLAVGQGNPALATDPKLYARYEPVAAPLVVLRNPPTISESLYLAVIRSDNNAPALDTTPTPETSERHIAPPKTGEDLAEAHGMFDGPGGFDPNSYATIAQYGDKSFSHISVLSPGSTQPSIYPIDPDAQAVLPYLPDPLSAGAALRFLPGVPASSVTPVSFPGTWPTWQPFRMILQEGAFGSHLNAGQRLLTVTLPKGESVTLRMSSYLPGTAPGNALGATPPAALELMGIWQWVENAAPATLAKLRALALQGRHWMLTPYRDLRLVHAVQQPLLAPTFSAFAPFKSLGDTFATFSGMLACDGKTTSELDFQARWTEPYDNPGDPTNTQPDVERINGQKDAFRIPLRFPLDALGRFPAGLVPSDDNGQTVAFFDPVQRTVAFNSIPNPQPGVPNPFGTAIPRHEFGDTKYRRVSYTPIGTTRFREYFPADVDPTQPNNTGAGNLDFTRRQATPTTVDILNSARPAAPKVLYVIPTFRVTGSGTTADPQVRRGGLRVYLERPWYSSGDGELLGAVLWNGTYHRFFPIPLSKNKVQVGSKAISKPGPQIGGGGGIISFPFIENDLPNKFRPFVSQWGSDPIWTSNAPRALPDINAFTNVADTSAATANDAFDPTMLTLDELPGETVSVAPFAVAFDATRNLWYCDIDVDPQTFYFPFIRLALVRCQPRSVPNAHLSRVVLADFAQITPERAASVVPSGDTLTVTVSGVSHGDSDLESHILTAGYESKAASDTGDLGWTPIPIRIRSGERFFQVTTVGLFPSTQDSVNYTWSRDLPQPAADPNSVFRLVLREYEPIDNEGAALPPDPNAPEQGVTRLIFAETMDVTSFVNS